MAEHGRGDDGSTAPPGGLRRRRLLQSGAAAVGVSLLGEVGAADPDAPCEFAVSDVMVQNLDDTRRAVTLTAGDDTTVAAQRAITLDQYETADVERLADEISGYTLNVTDDAGATVSMDLDALTPDRFRQGMSVLVRSDGIDVELIHVDLLPQEYVRSLRRCSE